MAAPAKQFNAHDTDKGRNQFVNSRDSPLWVRTIGTAILSVRTWGTADNTRREPLQIDELRSLFKARSDL